MGRYRRLVLVFILIVHCSGCTVYRPASLPPGDSIDQLDGAEEFVAPNNNVRVKLISGEKYSARVIRATEDELVLEEVGEFGVTELVLTSAEIEVLEVEAAATGRNMTLGGALVAAYLAVSAAVQLAK